MTSFSIHQALFAREGNGDPVLWARSPGFHEDWVPEAGAMILMFGNRPFGVACPAAVFAHPFETDQVAVVQVADRPSGHLAFRFLVIERGLYEMFLGDPFQLADKLPPDWDQRGALPELDWPHEPLPARTVDAVRDVLRRFKPQVQSENVVAENVRMERTAENSESPALLGSTQVLVEGGRVVFERPAPDTRLLQGLWMLLPSSTRNQAWPASFAFGNQLGFDAVVVPRAVGDDYEGYIHEQQAIEYPEGYYELNLQIAAEAGNQDELDALFDRRSIKQTWRLILTLLAVASLLSIWMQWDRIVQAVQRILRDQEP